MDVGTDGIGKPPNLTVIEGGQEKPKQKKRRPKRPTYDMPRSMGSGGGRRNEWGLTPKMEFFAVEAAKGGTLSEAYRRAYNTANHSQAGVWREASRLAKHPLVVGRIEQLVRVREQDALHDGARIKAFVIQNLQDLASNAKRDSDRIRANELLGKLTEVGAFTERTEQTIKDVRSAKEIETELKSELAALLGPRSEA